MEVLIDRTRVVERFLRYVKIHTQSDERSEAVPSTACQLDLSRLLIKELGELGFEARLDQYGIVMAHIPARNAAENAPAVGFLAHVDTSPETSGENVNPRTVSAYDGGEITLSEQAGAKLSPNQFPDLLLYKGEDIIVTDGTTLLGADDKAGVAAIMEALEWLKEHPDIPHAPMRIAFTVDEEVGRGADHFDVEAFGADFAYTIDGGRRGELQYECFNAASASLTFSGVSVHPGDAKGKMRNAITLARQFDALIPQDERPETTEDYEGFYHLYSINGGVDSTTLHYIIRDHDRTRFEMRKATIRDLVNKFNAEVECVTLKMEDQYYNMRERIAPFMHVVERAKEAIEASGVEPIIEPIRGGTDGARLSYMGLPCPNLFAGGHNFHGPFEFLPILSLIKASEVIVRLAVGYATP